MSYLLLFCKRSKFLSTDDDNNTPNDAGAMTIVLQSPDFHDGELNMTQTIRGRSSHFVFLNGTLNTNLVEDVQILNPVKCCRIPFSSFRKEVEYVSANQRILVFPTGPKKHKLARGLSDPVKFP